ncbi:MAG: hypothetical protein WAK93_01785 [Solirubrobacteraceae bacterium]
MTERKLPPFTQLGMLSLGLIVIGGIYLSAHIPQHVPLGPAIGLLIASIAVMAINLILLSRVPDFAWGRFFGVAKWALLVYAITAGMIEYVFVRNHVSGGTLVILTLSLIVYALQVPTLIAFTVARYADSSGVGADQAHA